MPTSPLLQALLERATTPLVPQSAIQGTQDQLTMPHLTQSPTMARIKGFGAGALSGLRDQTSPINLAGLASLAAGPLGRLAGMGAGTAVAPEVAEAANALKPTLTSFGKLAAPAVTRGAKVAETLGETNPMFTPVGAEDFFNATRPAQGVGETVDPLVKAYQQKWLGLLPKGSR